jgi:leucyl aminopeptidase (aminopeptidase T)
MRKRDEKIRDILRKCKSLSVEGRRVKGGRTSLVLDLTAILKRRSPVLSSDIEVNPKTELEAAKVFKQKNGRYGNFPGGEVFITPHKMNGTFVGDVVIAIDQSYVIGSKSPLVVSIKDGHYRILSGPKHILKAFNKRKKEAWQLIKEFEKKKSMPKQITDSYKNNFDRVGEFAINTNPKARLSRYLIETEKLARMIHIALGSGYEPDRETLYHCDIVINNPRQKMDIFGITPKGEMLWIIKQGKFAV